MKHAAVIVAALAPIALAVIEHRIAQDAKAETIEVARVLSEACLRTHGGER